MPTYKSRTVTATLHVANLDDTAATDGIAINKWPQNAQNAKRLEDILAAGDRLYERPIGVGDGEKDVASFIGEFGDLPFFMAETGEHIEHVSKKYGIRHTTERKSMEGVSQSSDTSSPDPLHEGVFSNKTRSSASRQDSVIDPIQAYQRLATPSQQAVSLAVETGGNACPPKQHLKVEVFLNGSLVDSTFINTKRFTLGASAYKHHFHGTRVTIQSEKPWVYQTVSGASEARLNAEERWEHVASALSQEATTRGYDASASRAPSTEYLIALATVKLPERLREKSRSNFGIFDVVITTGCGGKFGQEVSFATGPLRLSPANIANTQREICPLKEQVSNDAGSQKSGTMINTKELEPNTEAEPGKTDSFDTTLVLPSTSPEIPLAQRTRFAQESRQPGAATGSPQKQTHKPSVRDAAAKPNKKRTSHQVNFDAMMDELGLTPDNQKIVTSFKNRRGKEGQPRSINERVTDILKMNPENREKAKQDLLDQLSEKGMLLAKSTSTSGDQRRDSVIVTEDDGDIVMADPSGDPAAALAQNRIDFAIDMGAEPDGRLAKRIESLSPGQTTVKRFGASPWASSGEEDNTSLSEVSQRKATRNISASPRRLRGGRSRLAASVSSMSELTMQESSDLSAQISKPPLLPTSRSVSGSAVEETTTEPQRTSSSQDEAMDTFEVPDMCQCSSITYAGPGLHRSVGRVRPGQFDEQEFVVGMRFVVL